MRDKSDRVNCRIRRDTQEQNTERLTGPQFQDLELWSENNPWVKYPA